MVSARAEIHQARHGEIGFEGFGFGLGLEQQRAQLRLADTGFRLRQRGLGLLDAGGIARFLGF
jgi:hypothetical protein